MILVSPKFGISQISSLRNTVVSKETLHLILYPALDGKFLEVELRKLSIFTGKLSDNAGRGYTWTEAFHFHLYLKLSLENKKKRNKKIYILGICKRNPLSRKSVHSPSLLFAYLGHDTFSKCIF